jgi:hypothetical protein
MKYIILGQPWAKFAAAILPDRRQRVKLNTALTLQREQLKF